MGGFSSGFVSALPVIVEISIQRAVTFTGGRRCRRVEGEQFQPDLAIRSAYSNQHSDRREQAITSLDEALSK